MFRRRPRLSAAVAAGLLIAAVAIAPAPVAAHRTEAPAAAVTIDSFTPAAPKAGDPVRITGQVRNTGSVALENPQAIVCLQRDRLETRADLAAISPENDKPIDEQDSCGRLGNAFQPYTAPLAPNATVRFSLTVPWAEWGISGRPGVYVVGVQFRGDPGGAERVTAGRARTLMPVVGDEPMPRKVSTALMLPLRHRPTLLGGDRFANESLAQAMAPTGRLGLELAAGAGKKVTWLVDPAMLDEARRMANGYQVLGEDNKVRPGTGRQVARAWLDAFTAARSRNPVVLLPYGDPDVAGLIDAGEPLRELVGEAREATEQTTLTGGRPVRSGLWLETGSTTGRTLAAASTGYAGASPDDINLVPSWSWPVTDRPSLSPSPVYDVSTPSGPVTSVRSVIADSALTAAGPDPASGNSPVQARQRFAAETALLAAAGTGPLTVVASPSRSVDPDGRSTAGLVEGLSLPWITPADIEDVLSGAGARPRPAKTPTTERTTPGPTAAQLDQLRRLNGSIDVFAGLLTDPDAGTPSLDRSLLQATSTAWRGQSQETQRFLAYQQRVMDGLLGKVHLVKPSADAQGGRREIKVNLSGSKGTFPLTIANELDRSVRVSIQVTSSNRPDLRIEPLQTRVLGAGQKATYQVQASAEQNGLIQAAAQVVSAGGDPVGRPQELVIQAAQYGSVGWILVGSAVALLFGTSLVRIYRRIRSERHNPADQGPGRTTGPDPLNPAPLDLTPAEPTDGPEPAPANPADPPGAPDRAGPTAPTGPTAPMGQTGSTGQTGPWRDAAETGPDDGDNDTRRPGLHPPEQDAEQARREGVGTKDG